MKLLVVASNYPYEGNRFSGIFNQRSVEALKEHCESVAVLAPRPYVPVFVCSLPVGRWQAYARSNAHAETNGVAVHRPGYFHMPRFGSAFWHDKSAFFFSRHTAKQLHVRYRFDAILSFSLTMAGSLAWRLRRDLGIPASGWATGSDIRASKGTAAYRSVTRTLENLDLVFYQSRELCETAAEIMEASSDVLASTKHVVLSRGIPDPPLLAQDDVRKRERSALKITNDEILVLYVGRVVRGKGMMELLDAMSIAVRANSSIKCVIVGSKPAFDDTVAMQRALAGRPDLREHVKLLPECDPEKVWEYLCAADIFAFPSHREGMPNSLLEAMAMGVPAVAFAIPPVVELDNGSGALVAVPPLDVRSFADAVLRLAASPEERHAIGARGKTKVLENFMVRTSMAKAVDHLSRLVKEPAAGAAAASLSAVDPSLNP
jgi:teichuronic acid biosynthesis glycosyltransferase TuaC